VVCYTRVQWAVAGKKVGDGYGFPFDRPYLHLYRRLAVLRSALKRLGHRRTFIHLLLELPESLAQLPLHPVLAQPLSHRVVLSGKQILSHISQEIFPKLSQVFS